MVVSWSVELTRRGGVRHVVILASTRALTRARSRVQKIPLEIELSSWRCAVDDLDGVASASVFRLRALDCACGGASFLSGPFFTCDFETPMLHGSVTWQIATACCRWAREVSNQY